MQRQLKNPKNLKNPNSQKNEKSLNSNNIFFGKNEEKNQETKVLKTVDKKDTNTKHLPISKIEMIKKWEISEKNLCFSFFSFCFFHFLIVNTEGTAFQNSF